MQVFLKSMTLSSQYWTPGPGRVPCVLCASIKRAKGLLFTAGLLLTIQPSVELEFTRLDSDSLDLFQKTSLRARPTTAAFPATASPRTWRSSRAWPRRSSRKCPCQQLPNLPNSKSLRWSAFFHNHFIQVPPLD